jgi:hypothetical protein
MTWDWTSFLWIALGAALLWLIMRRRRAGSGLWARTLPVAIAVALAMGLLLAFQDKI